MSIQSETLRTPKLRFPEFSGEWVKRRSWRDLLA